MSMSAVEWKKLGDVCEVGTGSNNREDACYNGLYPFMFAQRMYFV